MEEEIKKEIERLTDDYNERFKDSDEFELNGMERAFFNIERLTALLEGIQQGRTQQKIEDIKKERLEMIDKTIRILNGAIGRLTSLQGNPVEYLRNKVKTLDELKSQLSKEKK